MPTAKKISAPAAQPELPAAPPAPVPPVEQLPTAPTSAQPEALPAPAPAEQPPVTPAPAEQPPTAPDPDPVFVTVRRTIGHAGRTWEPGEVVDVAVFEAIPGCDVERLIRKGALDLEG